jgi:RNA polymerase sigma factor (sigma-70 family)
VGSAGDGAAGRTGAGAKVAALFDAHARMVLAVCRTHLRNPQDAEDAAQQTFLSAYRALLGGTTPLDAPAWLATIARNECRQRIARRLSTPAIAPLGDDALDVPASADTVAEASSRVEIELLTTALAELPERQREAVLLRDVYGLSYDEVSAALSVSTPAVESLLSRGRRRLGERVRPIPLVVPAYLQDQLARLIPDFGAAGGTVAAGGGTAGLLAKLASTSLMGKVAAATAAATLAVGGDVAIRRDDGATVAKRGAEVQRVPLATADVNARDVVLSERAQAVVARAVARPHRGNPDPVAAPIAAVPAAPQMPVTVEDSTPAQEEDHSGPGGDGDDGGTTTGTGESSSGSSGPGPSSGSFGSDSSGPGSIDSGSSSSGSTDSGHSGSDSTGSSGSDD